MSQKVAAIAAGEAHTLALTGDGSVFSWGRGTFGRLGTAKEGDELFPVPISIHSSKNGSPAEHGKKGRPSFVGIAAGAYHSLALEDDGSVWSWGYNIYGQLGQGDDNNSSVPCIVERFLELGSPDSLMEGPNADHENAPFKVRAVKAGGMMSLAIDYLGGLWIWGNCPQLSTDSGEFCFMSSPAPMPVWDFHGSTVVKVACGNEHVVALVSTGEASTGGDLICYSWGSNSHGQLGLGDKENRPSPETVPKFNLESSWSVYEIACGASHTALLAQLKSSDEEISCECWTFGLGDNGQLGHGTTRSKLSPEPVGGWPQDAILISLDCGLFHTSVVSEAGDVWSWGMEKGLGLCPDAAFSGADAGDALSPLRIQFNELDGSNKFTGAAQVACGAAHTVVVSGDGYKLCAWGRGRSGVLGRGNTEDSVVPCVVMWPPPGEGINDGGLETDWSHAKAKNEQGIPTLVKETEGLNPADVGLSLTDRLSEEVQLLRSKVTHLERYTKVLHLSVFGKALGERNLMLSLHDSSASDVKKQAENMMESADNEELAQMEVFYRDMLASVKDKLMKRRIQEIVKEYIWSLHMRGQSSTP